MPETPPPESDRPDEEAAETAAWDAAEVMRGRAAQTREARDQSIAELRASMDDEQILDEFGIDLGEIER
ncbi:MAG TPA: hypothetical protein VFP89_11390 [Propionibacteriaceae bacterium]|nr:hypothetical protein [Propionibacteriaceae bacterium]